MDLQQMCALIASADTRHLQQAAAVCAVRPATLERRLERLAVELGFTLIDRSTRRIRLTPAAISLLPEARAALARNRAEPEPEWVPSSILRIGMSRQSTAVDLPPVLRGLQDDHPQLGIRLIVGERTELLAALDVDEIDVAVSDLLPVPDPWFAAGEVSRERLVAVLSPEHPWSQRGRLALGDLAGQFLVDFPTGTAERGLSDRAFAEIGSPTRSPWRLRTRMPRSGSSNPVGRSRCSRPPSSPSARSSSPWRQRVRPSMSKASSGAAGCSAPRPVRSWICSSAGSRSPRAQDR